MSPRTGKCAFLTITDKQFERICASSGEKCAKSPSAGRATRIFLTPRSGQIPLLKALGEGMSLSNPILRAIRNSIRRRALNCSESIQPNPASNPQPPRSCVMMSNRVYPTQSCEQSATYPRDARRTPRSLSNPILRAIRNQNFSACLDRAESIQPNPASNPQQAMSVINFTDRVYPTQSCEQSAMDFPPNSGRAQRRP